MNETQRQAINDCIETAIEYLCLKQNSAELLGLVLNYDPNNIGFSNLLNQTDVPTRTMLTNLRALVIGGKVFLEENHGAYQIKPSGGIPYGLDRLGPITSQELACHTREILQERQRQLQQAEGMFNSGLAQAENIVVAIPGLPNEGIEGNQPPASNNFSVWESLQRIFNGIGRGCWNFVMRLITPFIHPIQTFQGSLQGLYLILTDPAKVYYALKDRLINYATTDPIAFTTDVFLNISLIALAASLPPVLGPVGGTAITGPTAGLIGSSAAAPSFGMGSMVVPAIVPVAATAPGAITSVAAPLASAIVATQASGTLNSASLPEKKSDNPEENKMPLQERIKNTINTSKEYKLAQKMLRAQVLKTVLPQSPKKKLNSEFKIDLFAPVEIRGEPKNLKQSLTINLFEPVEIKHEKKQPTPVKRTPKGEDRNFSQSLNQVGLFASINQEILQETKTEKTQTNDKTTSSLPPIQYKKFI